jgi:hypothetical protein
MPGCASTTSTDVPRGTAVPGAMLCETTLVTAAPADDQVLKRVGVERDLRHADSVAGDLRGLRGFAQLDEDRARGCPDRRGRRRLLRPRPRLRRPWRASCTLSVSVEGLDAESWQCH